MTCDIILTSIPEIKERNKEIKVKEKNRKRQKTKSNFINSNIERIIHQS